MDKHEICETFKCPECGQFTSNRTFQINGHDECVALAERRELDRWFYAEAFYPSVATILAETRA